jgi:ribosome-associated protein
MTFKVPFHEIEFSTTRSRGPGGQNVNRTNSAVIAKWNPRESSALTEMQKERVIAKLATQLTADGFLQVRSDALRDQDRNRSECIQKLNDMVARSLLVPKKRVKTKPTRGSQIRRMDSKSKHAVKKQTRMKVERE